VEYSINDEEKRFKHSKMFFDSSNCTMYIERKSKTPKTVDPEVLVALLPEDSIVDVNYLFTQQNIQKWLKEEETRLREIAQPSAQLEYELVSNYKETLAKVNNSNSQSSLSVRNFSSAPLPRKPTNLVEEGFTSESPLQPTPMHFDSSATPVFLSAEDENSYEKPFIDDSERKQHSGSSQLLKDLEENLAQYKQLDKPYILKMMKKVVKKQLASPSTNSQKSDDGTENLTDESALWRIEDENFQLIAVLAECFVFQYLSAVSQNFKYQNWISTYRSQFFLKRQDVLTMPDMILNFLMKMNTLVMGS